MILVAAPSCAGKSHLMKAMERGERPWLCAQLGMDTEPSWSYLHAAALMENGETPNGALVAHCDLSRADAGGIRFARWKALIAQARSVSVLTLEVSPEALRRRNAERLRHNLKAMVSRPKWRGVRVARVWRQWMRRREYGDASFVSTLYEDWLGFVAGSSATAHWIVDGDPTVTPPARPVFLEAP